MTKSTTKWFFKTLTLLGLFVYPALVVNAQTTDTYSTPGTVDWVVPPCVTSVTVRAWGGGGAGGGSSSTDRNGGGGGGGAFCTYTETVTPGETLRITVGAGGTGVNSGTGGAGGFSQVMHLTGSVVFCRAAGGAGGTKGSSSSSAGAGGAGGQISANIPANTGFRGGTGGNSDPNTGSADRSGGGGGGAGTAGNGSNGGIVTAGAGTAAGGGNGGVGISTTSSGGGNGSPGNNLGGGGGGSTTYSSGSRAGANGARGEVTITYIANGCSGPTSVEAMTTPGTYNWVVPPCVTSVSVEVWGGGGGGGGTVAIMRSSNGSEACSGAGGGGGGGYAAGTFAVTPGQTYTVVVGAGGTAGAPGNGSWSSGITTPAGQGGTGGTSSFSGFAINIQGTGGVGGGGASTYNNNNSSDVNAMGTAGNGGTGSGGSVSNTGGNGAPGYVLNFSTDKSGAGGGGAGPGGNGGNAPLGSSYGIIDNNVGGTGDTPGGNGGTSRMNNLPTNTSKNGGNGNAIGGGGGGALNHKDGFGMVNATGGAGGRGEVRLTYAGCPLPVSLVSFEAECDGEATTFTWVTASEENNDYFTIEQSENGQAFEAAKIIDGSGNSQEIHTYQTRLLENDDNYYYRLVQTDFDGTTKYSDVINVSCEDVLTEDFTIYPNPITNNFTLTFNRKLSGYQRVVIYDMIGRTVYDQKLNLTNRNQYIINCRDFEAGSFIVEVYSEVSGERIGCARLTKE